MPRLTLEYTANVRETAGIEELAGRFHAVLASLGGLRIGNCKSRWRSVDDFFVGDGVPDQGFVHLSIRLLEGRPLEVRQEIGRRCLALLKEHFATSFEELDLQITVEVTEIARALYFKEPAGTFSPPPPGGQGTGAEP